MTLFEKLNAVNVNGKTETKGELTYLSWCYAWAELKKADPLAYYTIYENADGWNYHTDRVTCWVKVGVTAHYGTASTDGTLSTLLSVAPVEHIEYLPVMDYKNRSIPFENVTSIDVNKAIQRAITKAIARHGLGLYIYAGEDLPEVEKDRERELNAVKDELIAFCNQYGEDVAPKVWKKYRVAEMTNPDDVRNLIADYKAKAEARAKESKANE